jgi:carbon-monoxide dehydrogenase medium subunit
MDIAVTNAAAQLRFDGDAVSWARVAIGAVAPTPLLVAEAAEQLTGRSLTDETIAAAAAATRAAARPIADMRGSVKQRRRLASVLVERTLRGAADRAGRRAGNGGTR